MQLQLRSALLLRFHPGHGVSGFVEGEDGLTIFVKAIPYNFYALLTLVMMVGMVLLKAEFGPMRTHEHNAINGDIYTTSARPYATAGK